MRDLVTTKLYVPRIDRELVDRPRLIVCLEAGSTGKLTLVSAPVGYGKTTLVSDWLTRSHMPAAWLSLESDELMSQQSEEVRSFLLCTSILERFNASLCCALLQKPNGREMLRALEKARLFLVPLDDECKWYRYHRLFADFLHQRLVETRPEIVSELYQRAGDWYEAQGMIEEAIEYALTGNDATRAALILDEHIESYVYNGEVMKVLQWTDRLPVEVRRRFPRLCIYQAWALQFEHRLDAVERPLELAEDHLMSPDGSSESFPASQIIGHATAIRAYTALKRGEYNLGPEDVNAGPKIDRKGTLKQGKEEEYEK